MTKYISSVIIEDVEGLSSVGHAVADHLNPADIAALLLLREVANDYGYLDDPLDYEGLTSFLEVAHEIRQQYDDVSDAARASGYSVFTANGYSAFIVRSEYIDEED